MLLALRFVSNTVLKLNKKVKVLKVLFPRETALHETNSPHKKQNERFANVSCGWSVYAGSEDMLLNHIRSARIKAQQKHCDLSARYCYRNVAFRLSQSGR